MLSIDSMILSMELIFAENSLKKIVWCDIHIDVLYSVKLGDL